MVRKLGFVLIVASLVIGLLAAGALAAKKDQVVIWERVMYGGDQAWWDAFKATYDGMMSAIGRNVEVVVDLMPWSGSDEKWRTAFLAGEPPDIGRHLYGGMDQLIEEGIIVPLNDLVTPEERKNLGGDRLFKAITQPNGKFYALPGSIVGPTQWAINTELVREAGFNPDTILTKGWTFDDVIAIGKKVTDVSGPLEKRTYGFGSAGDNVWRMGYVNIQARDIEELGNAMLNSKGEYAWNDKGLLATYTFFHDMMYKHKIWPKEMLGMKQAQVEQMFLEGRIAILDTGSGVLDRAARYNAAIKAGTQKGKTIQVYPVILPRPSFMKEHTATEAVAQELFVFKQKKDKGPEHLENVMAAYKLLMGPLGQSRVAQFGWVLPGYEWTRTAYEKLIDPKDPLWALRAAQLKWVKSAAPFPKLSEERQKAYGQMEVIVNDLNFQMISGKLTPTEMIERFNAEAKKLGFKIAKTSVVD